MVTINSNTRTTFKVFILLALISGILMVHEHAHARKYECEAVSSKALLGASYWDVVVISADESDKVCKFSVNGASAGSPPQEELFSAYTGLFGGPGGQSGAFRNLPNIIRDDPGMGSLVELLSTMILAAGPDTRPEVISKMILSYPEILKDCLISFNANEKYRNVGDVECGVASWNLLSGDSYDAGPFSIIFREDENPALPTFILTVERGATWNLLAIPMRTPR